MTDTDPEIDEGTPRLDAQRAQIAQRRYREECRGVLVNGERYQSDRESRGNITGSIVAAQQSLSAGTSFALRWKTRSGWVQLDAAQMIDVGNAVLDHVQACFDRESALLDTLEDGNYTDDMLGTGWPSSSGNA